MRYFLVIITVTVLSCTFLTDPAVRLANCINDGAMKLKHSEQRSIEINCSNLNESEITVILFPTEGATLTQLRSMGIADEALVVFKTDSLYEEFIFVYDSYYSDNRRWSFTTSHKNQCRISQIMTVITAGDVGLVLSKNSFGDVEVMNLK